MTSCDATTAPRKRVLLMLSEELSDLGTSASALQATLSDILQGTPNFEGNGFWHMQEIDRLQQALDDLAAILRAAAEQDGPRLDVESLARVARLGSLRDRIRGSNGSQSAGQDAGIVAIF